MQYYAIIEIFNKIHWTKKKIKYRRYQQSKPGVPFPKIVKIELQKHSFNFGVVHYILVIKKEKIYTAL